MSDQKPSVGRAVHYVSYGTPGGEYQSQCRAATITEVKDDQTVSLFVMNPTGVFLNQDCPYDDGGGSPSKDPSCQIPHEGGPFRYCACGWSEASLRGGTWHWPERV